jgi:hypothetical protein
MTIDNPEEESRQGDKGETGERGAQGDQGQKGVEGATGPQGVAAIGLIGERGQTGDHGQHGDRGDPGIQGLTGVPGVRGATGSVGAEGTPGASGVAGVPGKQGQQGVVPKSFFGGLLALFVTVMVVFIYLAVLLQNAVHTQEHAAYLQCVQRNESWTRVNAMLDRLAATEGLNTASSATVVRERIAAYHDGKVTLFDCGSEP